MKKFNIQTALSKINLSADEKKRNRESAEKLLHRIDVSKMERFFRRCWKAIPWIVFFTVVLGEQAGYSFGWWSLPKLWVPFGGYFEGLYPAVFPLTGWLPMVFFTIFLAFMPKLIRGVWWGVEWAGWAAFAATIMFTTWK